MSAAETPSKSAATAHLKMVSPEFAVPDVAASAEYYRDVLGFRILGYFLDPPAYAMVGRDDVVIHLGKSDKGASPSPNVARREIGLDAYVWVSDVHALHAELQGRGARILEAPVLRAYKCLEMVVEDNCKFRLAFSQDLSGGEGQAP